tara:strand:+ start:460 stop:687 length:228 start_codon:yes stop_codon:yes gene_type:complete
MSDRITEYNDTVDSILDRLLILEEHSHPPINWLEEINDFQEEVKARIIDLNSRLDKLEDHLESIRCNKKSKSKKS